MVEVTLWGSLAPVAEGNSKVEVEAKDIRELFKRSSKRLPGLEPLVDRGIAVAIDGIFYRDTWLKGLLTGTEIYLLPRLTGRLSRAPKIIAPQEQARGARDAHAYRTRRFASVENSILALAAGMPKQKNFA